MEWLNIFKSRLRPSCGATFIYVSQPKAVDLIKKAAKGTKAAAETS
jgi:hypothetical protein